MPKSAAEAPPDVIRIVIVEPYALVRASLHEILDWEQGLAIVGEVADVGAAIALVRDDPVDVVLVDAEPAIADLVPVLQRLKRECPASPVVLIGHRRDDSELFEAIKAGAAAHVLDTARPPELIRTIRAVAAGEYLIDASVAARPAVAARVLEVFRDASRSGDLPDHEARSRAFEQLSAREREILTAISQGMSNKDIARALSISPHTVHNVVQSALRKLAVNNRTQAVLVALRESWIRLPDQPIHRDH